MRGATHCRTDRRNELMTGEAIRVTRKAKPGGGKSIIRKRIEGWKKINRVDERVNERNDRSIVKRRGLDADLGSHREPWKKTKTPGRKSVRRKPERSRILMGKGELKKTPSGKARPR